MRRGGTWHIRRTPYNSILMTYAPRGRRRHIVDDNRMALCRAGRATCLSITFRERERREEGEGGGECWCTPPPPVVACLTSPLHQCPSPSPSPAISPAPCLTPALQLWCPSRVHMCVPAFTLVERDSCSSDMQSHSLATVATPTTPICSFKCSVITNINASLPSVL